MGDCIAFVDARDNGIPEAAKYFDMFRQEPIGVGGEVTIGNIIPMNSTTIYALLTSIVQNNVNTFVLACHANPKALLIPLVKQDQNFLDGSAIDALTQTGGSKESQNAKAKEIQLSLEELAKLQAAVAACRKVNIDRVIIRGCNIGSNYILLQKLKSVFGARSICAPKVPDFFGFAGSPDPAPKVWEKWATDHPNAKYSKDREFSWDFVQPSQHKINITFSAKTRESLLKGVREQIGPSKYSGTGFIYWEALRALEGIVLAREDSFRSLLQNA